jgi:hypothetical protein
MNSIVKLFNLVVSNVLLIMSIYLIWELDGDAPTFYKVQQAFLLIASLAYVVNSLVYLLKPTEEDA